MVNTTEYVAGVMDLTGEIGRFAVVQATKREMEAVQRCLEMDSFIGRELERTTLPDKANRKRSEFRRNHMKLETLLYELSLTRAGKGRVAESAVLSDDLTGMLDDSKGRKSGKDDDEA